MHKVSHTSSVIKHFKSVIVVIQFSATGKYFSKYIYKDRYALWLKTLPNCFKLVKVCCEVPDPVEIVISSKTSVFLVSYSSIL